LNLKQTRAFGCFRSSSIPLLCLESPAGAPPAGARLRGQRLQGHGASGIRKCAKIDSVTETLHDTDYRGFASDNYAGIHPEVLAAIAAANGGHQIAYGEDVYTQRLQEVFAQHFGEGVQAFPVFNGTGANVVGLQSMLPRWGAVVCASTAHIQTDENGAPERIGGLKLLTVDTPDGKLTPELIDQQAWGWGDEHRAQPLVVSITQTTELGTCYSADEIRAIADHAHSLGMKLHVDGARIANAAATLDSPLRAFTTDAGVDVLSFGGTKNGVLLGEAIVILNPDAAEGLPYLRKFNMQLASKMRFVSAQLIALLEGDLWLRSAQHANAMAARLRGALDVAIASGSIAGLSFSQPTQANGVFATLPAGVADTLRESFRFYDWDAARNEVRWMCSWDTTEADIDAFVAAITRELAA
jgi:threonine aldolase